ncbi:MAG: alpha/beta fold hydrolase [Candidatus Nanopelagicales bacterium]|nr:hypothetical protein [Candidatus Nanopelagicales bacterium]
MPIAVPIVAGTAIKGVAANLMMRGVMERHPNAFLITLQSYGITLPLHKSQEHISQDIQKGLEAQGRAPDSPLVLVGHSQGALAALRYAINNPTQVVHVFSVGCPWHGSVSAANTASRIRRLTGINIAAALRDMAPNSTFLTSLHDDLPTIASRVTNIYSTHEIFIRPYTCAHIDVPGVSNVLISTEDEYAKHLRTFPDLSIDELIIGRRTHIGEMNSPEVRSLIWAKVDELGQRFRDGEAGPVDAVGT